MHELESNYQDNKENDQTKNTNKCKTGKIDISFLVSKRHF